MKFYSPLRYPGGKNKLAKFIASICIDNDINGHYVEPYAGGASVALHLLFEGFVKKITINDFDKSIYAFWYSVLNNTDGLCKQIYETDVTIENWRKQKKIQKNKENESDLLKLGFSTFFLNRTNYSGIINAGVIGGTEQKSNYKINCRYNKEKLIEKIQFISHHKSDITLKNMDAIELIKNIKKDKNTIFYFDPPYYLMGPSLYMNHYEHGDHERVGREIAKLKNANWIVSYDNTPEIKEIYKDFKTKEYSFVHTAHNARIGKEILVYSHGLKTQDVESPTKYKCV